MELVLTLITVIIAATTIPRNCLILTVGVQIDVHIKCVVTPDTDLKS